MRKRAKKGRRIPDWKSGGELNRILWKMRKRQQKNTGFEEWAGNQKRILWKKLEKRQKTGRRKVDWKSGGDQNGILWTDII